LSVKKVKMSHNTPTEAQGGEEVKLQLIQYMGLSGKHHAPAALYPQGKDPR
jgi:hypothetical protein